MRILGSFYPAGPRDSLPIGKRKAGWRGLNGEGNAGRHPRPWRGGSPLWQENRCGPRRVPRSANGSMRAAQVKRFVAEVTARRNCRKRGGPVTGVDARGGPCCAATGTLSGGAEVPSARAAATRSPSTSLQVNGRNQGPSSPGERWRPEACGRLSSFLALPRDRVSPPLADVRFRVAVSSALRQFHLFLIVRVTDWHGLGAASGQAVLHP